MTKMEEGIRTSVLFKPFAILDITTPVLRMFLKLDGLNLLRVRLRETSLTLIDTWNTTESGGCKGCIDRSYYRLEKSLRFCASLTHLNQRHWAVAGRIGREKNFFFKRQFNRLDGGSRLVSLSAWSSLPLGTSQPPYLGGENGVENTWQAIPLRVDFPLGVGVGLLLMGLAKRILTSKRHKFVRTDCR